ncbi:MAG TPA: hypothetical protein IGS17_18915 [Oscillatoriales cyanobacterium M59_W2019_021]|nr:MAG: hypothetical protein D6728_00245 [Cyanobacteria bacterium J055]HIK29740.1 hypothetical protein [Oscillatoriales cyanobacterium M4454_W2019_049]HIK52969.1 hypothetical protein [Oscillatoriales cyanobacterium M59_W2019_021]
MSAEVPENPKVESRMETLQRLQSTIAVLQGVVESLESQPQMTVSDSEVQALAGLAERLQPVAAVPPVESPAIPTPTVTEVAVDAVSEPAPPMKPVTSPVSVVPQPETKPSLLERVFDRVSLKVSLITFAIAAAFIAILVKLLLFPFPHVSPLPIDPQANPPAQTTPVQPQTPQAAAPAPTAPAPEVPIPTATPQVVVTPAPTSETPKAPQVVVVPSSDSGESETPQIIVIPSSDAEDSETPQAIAIAPSNSEDGKTSLERVVIAPTPLTEETAEAETPEVVVITPEPANEVTPEEDDSSLAEVPVAIETPPAQVEPSLPPTPTSAPTSKEAAPAPTLPAKPTPEQRFIAAIQTQVAQMAQKYVEDPSIDSLNANFADSLLQIRVADLWFDLPNSKQNQLAKSWMKQAKDFDFQTLEILDRKGAIVARSPVVGSEMIILQR